jgi:hypothetical protein
MKRLFLLIVVVMVAYWVMRAHHRTFVQPAGPPGHWNGPIFTHDRDARRHFVSSPWHEVRPPSAPEDIAALDELQAPEREEAEGLPVRIVPGTRVTEARAVPPSPPKKPNQIRRRARFLPPLPAVNNVSMAEIPTLAGEISATPERAEADARRKLRETISAWLDPDVPRSWAIPGQMLDALVQETSVETVQKDYGTLYITHLKLDTRPERRAQFVRAYNHELVGRRLVKLGGSLGFILICLAAVSGYIRADEATKGYYTKRLRMLAAAGVGAGGVLIYQMLT